MKILFPRLCTCIALFIFTLTVNAQTERQLEIADLIKKELGINEILIPHKGDTNLFFDYEEFLCYVYPGSNYIRIHVTARSADPNIFLYKRSNSNLEKKVIQVFKQHINEVNKKYHITKAYWSIYEEPHFQVLSTFSTSIPMDANDAWISDLKETITSTGISMKLFKEKLVMSLSKICWEVKENETDPDVLREAIFWAKYNMELQPDADRTYIYANVLFKAGQTLLALEKINETIELYKKENQNYDLSTALKEKLVSLIYKDHIGLYNTRVKNQEWKTYNLRTQKFRNGDEIFHAKTKQEWTEAGEKGVPAYCYYNNDNTYGFRLGKLYNWYAINDPRGLAREGWHIPTKEEWNLLITFFGKDKMGKYLKSKNNWGGDYDSDGNGEGERYFSAFPGGCRDKEGDFILLGSNGYWWSATENENEKPFSIRLSDDDNGVVPFFSANKAVGYSVRCLKD